MNKDTVTWLKRVYWLIIVLTILSTIWILCFYRYPVSIDNSTASSDTIFSNGLNLIFSIIAFLIASIIFMRQYVSTKFNSHELDKFAVSSKYFIITPIVLVIYIIFNLVAIYYQLIFPYTLLSFIFSVSVILLVSVTVYLSSYYFDITNILKELTEHVIEIIKKPKSSKIILYRNVPAGYSDEFISLLNEKTSIFIKITIESINKDQDKIFRTSLESLDKILANYLTNSKDFQMSTDVFLSEMNDQFNFIIANGLKSYNQKILEDIATTIGKISVNIIEYRKPISNRNIFAIHWVATLSILFRKSYPKDRTHVCNICLDKINKVILCIIEKGYYNSYRSYKNELDRISLDLAANNQLWDAILLQKALSLQKSHFLKFLTIAKEGDGIFGDNEIKSYFDTFAKIINNSKIQHESSNLEYIFASLYGVTSFAQEIARIGLTPVPDQNKKIMAQYMELYLDFNKQILYEYPEKNDFTIYAYFSEVLFLITKSVDLIEEDKDIIIESLSNDLLDFLELIYKKSVTTSQYDFPPKLKENSIDYFALLIFFNYNKPLFIAKIIQRFMEIYESIKILSTNNNERFFKELYEQLKLYSCWINVYPELNSTNSNVINLLKKDFYEPILYETIFIHSSLGGYGYPQTYLNDDSWHLSPSYMWGVKFQEEIERKLNGNGIRSYIEFHNLLKTQV